MAHVHYFCFFCFDAPWLPYAENVRAFVNHLFFVIQAANSLGFEVTDCNVLESFKKSRGLWWTFRVLHAKAHQNVYLIYIRIPIIF